MPGCPIHPITQWRLAQTPPVGLADLAARLPCSVTYLWKIENGRKPPSVELVRKVVAATDITADAIIWWAPSDSCSEAA